MSLSDALWYLGALFGMWVSGFSLAFVIKSFKKFGEKI